MRNYNYVQRLLHDLILGNRYVNRSLLEIEKLIFLKQKNIKDNYHLFITGLPRSGTTILLNYFYSFGEFASLKYSNMPFVMAPNISKFFYGRNLPKKERLHSDGITFDLSSPEAFDEIFFKNQDNYVKNECLNYLKLVLISEKKNKYLSKNNLNFKRINLIKSILPNSIFFLTIREPLQQSYSLLNQHIHFSKLQKKDAFILRYMNYLNHKEFGLSHKPWFEPVKFQNTNSINYWLEQWSFFYDYVFKEFSENPNCKFIVYEKLSKLEYLKKLLKLGKINNTKKLDQDFFTNSNKKISLSYDKDIYERALNKYKRIEDKSISSL